eukprot:gene15497-32761_t
MGPNGPIGQFTQSLGLGLLPFSFAGLLLGSVIYSLPFVVQPLHNAFEALGDGPLEAAATLRASPLDTFLHVVLPLAKPGYLSASVLGFPHTVGEFGVVLMIGGNIPGKTHVVSIQIYGHVEAMEYAQAHWLAGGMVVFSFLAMMETAPPLPSIDARLHLARPGFTLDPGRVVVNGEVWQDDDAHLWRATHERALGYVFQSQTDTEVIAHLIDSLYEGDVFAALQAAVVQLHGAYALAVFHKDEPHRVVGARAGSPLVLGVGTVDGVRGAEHFLASDAMALAGVTDQIVYLEEGDLVDLQLGRYWVLDAQGRALDAAKRPVKTVQAHSGAAERGPYRHYMQKEIFEQPRAIADTLEGVEGIVPELFDGAGQHGQPGAAAWRVFKEIDNVLILACGTSYYSGCAAKYWLEEIAGIPTQVEVASEYRYRTSVPNPRTLVVTISQSGETADTLAALRHAQSLGMQHTLTICNVATSAMVRECKLAYITRAGVEIGVASTKAFTTQLAGLFLLTLALAQSKGRLSEEQEAAHLKAMRHLPVALQAVLALEPQLISWAEDFARMENALFLGRGLHYPI